MNARSLRLVPVAVAAWLAAAVTTTLPEAAPAVALACWACVVAALAIVALESRSGRRVPSPLRLIAPAAVVIVLTLLVGAAAASHTALAQPQRAAAAELPVSGGRALEVTAVMTGKAERWSSGVVVFDAIASEVRIGDERHGVHADVQVRADEAPTALSVGATVVVAGTARPADAGERAVLIISAGRPPEIITEPGGVLAVAAALRSSLVTSLTGLPQPGAGLVPGLAVGDTSGVGAELDAAMKASSLSHLTAVSGANCAIVVGLAFGLAAAAGAGRRLRVALALSALAGFVVLVTPEPSVVRAGVMASVAMLGVLFGRPGAGISVLSLSVAMLLISDPWLATSLGFALSVAATASLLLFARPIAEGLARRLPRALALALAVPLAAQLACGPLLVLIEPTVPVYGVVANLLAAPAAPVATIIGLAACLAAPVPWVQLGLSAIAWAPASWIAGTARTFADLPGAAVPWLDGPTGLITLAIVGIAIGVVAAGRGGRRARAVAGTLIAVVVGVAAGNSALGGIAGRFTLPAAWSVLACDVGQGDAVLLRSAGRTALIDTGPDPMALERCLDLAGVGRLDLLVLTHFDLDHVGGAAAVRGRVATVVHGPVTSASDTAVLATLGAEATHEAWGGQRGTLGDAAWRVLWPPRDSRAFPSGNDASVVVEFSGGSVPHSVFLGDLSASPQRALAAAGDLRPPYALVKVAHHGSADQDAALYRLLAPSIALVTVGDNDYGHPRDEAISLATATGARLARTDRDGVVALTVSDAGVQIWRERAGE